MNRKHQLVFLAAIAGLSIANVSAAPHYLSTGTGDGTVTVGVDGYGAFGGWVSADSDNAYFDPVGLEEESGTTFFSSLLIGFQGDGFRDALHSGSYTAFGELGNPTVTGNGSSATSSFTFGGLTFGLTQSIVSTANGVVLTQTYSIQNTGENSSSFDIFRYFDGDLTFDGSISDGGGRIISGGTEILFETDTATGSSSEATFVGITGLGGTIPTEGRYEISGWPGLIGAIFNGDGLLDIVEGDGVDADEFIDSGEGYDVTLALRNSFTLEAGDTAEYTTHTIFGVQAPDDVQNPTNPVPEPATVISGAAFAALAIFGAKRRKKA